MSSYRVSANKLEVDEIKSATRFGSILINSEINNDDTDNLTVNGKITTTSDMICGGNVKTDYIQVKDGAIVQVLNPMNVTLGLGVPNLTVDKISTNTLGGNIMCQSDLGVTGPQKFMANKIEPVSGYEVIIGRVGDGSYGAKFPGYVNVDGDIDCANILKVDTIWSHSVGDVTIDNNVAMTSDVTMSGLSDETGPTKVLTLNGSNLVKYVSPHALRSPGVNEFFDDFSGYAPSTYRTASEEIVTFDKVWRYRGQNLSLYPYQVATDAEGSIQPPQKDMNGIIRIEPVNFTSNGQRFYYGINNYSSFNTQNGDITFECYMNKPYADHAYYTDLKMFFGLGYKSFNYSSFVGEMEKYVGFEFMNTLSGSPNDYWSIVYDYSNNGVTRSVTTVPLFGVGEFAFKLKFVITSTYMYFYINDSLVKTVLSTFAPEIILQPRWGIDVTRSATDQISGPKYGPQIDYIYVFQDYSRSTI